jgi:hypothetical protein
MVRLRSTPIRGGLRAGTNGGSEMTRAQQIEATSRCVGLPYALLAHFPQQTIGVAQPIDQAEVSGWAGSSDL